MVKIKRIKGDYSGLFASQQIDKNQLILVLDGNGFDVPTRTSIQVRDKHIEDVNGGFMNHHCDPSAVIVVVELIKEGLVVARRKIEEGEEITFDYETTEEHMAEPFHCECHGRLIEGWNSFKRV
tara:strand:- start:411 stop:782 length:372 start_codon:yes stop_codon:yes gene_type:complete